MFFNRLTRPGVIALAIGSVAIVAGLDYISGYELSFSLFYIGPVAFATMYAGRRAGVGVAIISCIAWYFAEILAGAQYSHPLIPVWNAAVRLGFFLITCLLLSALRSSLLRERQLARTDSLTGLYARRAFEERLGHDLVLARRRRSAISLAYLDLDDFKAVNDAHGHAEGDQALQTVGRILRTAVREADTAARLGGDEFAVLLPDTDDRGAEQVMTKVRRDLGKALEAWDITCSIGVTTFVEPALSATAAVAAADALMYEVKRQGKSAIAYRAIEPNTDADS